MTITERLFVILAQKKITQKDFAKQINVNEKTVSAWKKNNSLPPLDKISNISDFLNISIDYLLTGKEKSSPAEQLTDDERELLAYYRELDKREKGIIFGEAKALFEYSKNNNQLSNTISIKLYDISASAGTGSELNNEDYEIIQVEENLCSKKADFAIKVNGDSMIPKYNDGDILLVKSQQAVNIGEFCIYTINGKSYVKKFGGDCLISINPAYDDIPLREYDSVYCQGLVIGKAENINLA